MKILVSITLFLFLPTLFSFAQPSNDKLQPEDFVTGGWAQLGVNNCVLLTPDQNWTSGSVWHKKPIDLNAPFEMEVELSLGCKDGDGADGIVFVFHPRFNEMGFMGEGMGFAGLRPSLGIEIDTWQNEHLADPPQDHIALLKNGSMDHYYNLMGPNRIPNIEDCRRHLMKVDWDPSDKRLTIRIDGKVYLKYKGDIIKNTFKGNSKVYWGVTAATGAYNNRHALCFEKLIYEEDATIIADFDPLKKADLLKGEIRSVDQLDFSPNGATLKIDSYKELDKLYRLLEENPAYSLEIFGHTDNVGGEKQNKNLSQKRADAVANYLIKRGISKKRLHSIGHGELYPLVSNATPEGRSINRRVEIHLFKPIP